RARLLGLARRQVELEVLALPHVLDRAVAERVQRVRDGSSLRIEHRWLQRDKHLRTHARYTFSETGWKTRSKIWSTCFNWSSRSNARSMSTGVNTRMTSASASSSAFSSRPSSNDRMALRCTHS